MRTFTSLKSLSLSLATLFALSSAACAVDDPPSDDMDMESEASQDSQWMDWQHAELDPGIDREGNPDVKTPPRRPLEELADKVRRFESADTTTKLPLDTEGEAPVDADYCELHAECESNLCDQRINRCYVPRF